MNREVGTDTYGGTAMAGQWGKVARTGQLAIDNRDRRSGQDHQDRITWTGKTGQVCLNRSA
jgi:hypothetical protein